MVEYQHKKLGIFRTREILSILPFIVVGDIIVWTGVWFKKVTVEEEQYMERYLKFDDGWSYQFYWGGWKTRWEFVRIVKK